MPEALGRSGYRARVLVVEDNEDMASMLAVFLEPRGYEVEVALTFAAATSALEEPWDAILSDIGLVDGSGLELARRIESLGRRPPLLVALSGYGTAPDLAASSDAGFDHHLVKPVDLERLLELLEASLTARVSLPPRFV